VSAGRHRAQPGAALGRRLLLIGGGLTGLAAPLVADRTPARAASGDPVLLGRRNTATAVTTISNTREGSTTLRVTARGESSVGVQAESPNIAISASSEQGTGVQGESVFGNALGGHSLFGYGVRANSGDGVGVDGESREGTGVTGISHFGIGVAGSNLASDQPAVRGHSGNGSTGVQGLSLPDGVAAPATSPRTGVHGQCDGRDGTGVLARSEDGAALRVEGSAVFSRSGVLTVPAGATSATRTGVRLSDASLVLAVPQRHQVLRHVEAVVPHPGSSSFTVHLNLPASPGCVVAWFVVN
jgi:hypothetical protein